MRHTDDLRLGSHQRFQLVQTEQSIIRDGNMLDDNPPFHRLQLPRNDVRVVLHLSDNHLIALSHL